jgi:hypothetical protein
MNSIYWQKLTVCGYHYCTVQYAWPSAEKGQLLANYLQPRGTCSTTPWDLLTNPPRSHSLLSLLSTAIPGTDQKLEALQGPNEVKETPGNIDHQSMSRLVTTWVNKSRLRVCRDTTGAASLPEGSPQQVIARRSHSVGIEQRAITWKRVTSTSSF